MFSHIFPAMTKQEIQLFQPKKAAYMACHFSPYGQGLSNLPAQLPKSCLLLLDDSTPIAGHNPVIVTQQLNELVEACSPKALLLDFQRQKCAKDMIAAILTGVRCPVAVSEKHCAGFDCPVFLSPIPVNQAPEKYLKPFINRGVYLEIAPEAMEITVTAKGSKTAPLPLPSRDLPLQHKRLYCHYDVAVAPQKAVFTLHRTGEDLAALTNRAYKLGVLGVVGFYQELNDLCAK